MQLFTYHLLFQTISRNTVAVGAPFDGEDGTDTGSVFLYKEESENNWELQGDKITPADGVDEDLFGFSVDLDNDSTLLIGSRVSHGDECSSSYFTIDAHI